MWSYDGRRVWYKQNRKPTSLLLLSQSTKEVMQQKADTKAISNLVRAIEQGIFNDATKQRMDELDEQKAEIKAALASAKLKENLSLTKEHMVYFLHQFANMDYTDLECQKRLIKTFINSVFVYDDKVVLTFNYSGDNRTITLMEIDAGLQQGVRLQSDVGHQKKKHTKRCVSFFA